MLGYSDIISNIHNLGEHTEKKYDVVAVGGTSLVLHNIKNVTYDVDFIVESGDVMGFEIEYKKYCGNMIDVSAPGECFGTRLPSDYISQSTYIDTFGGVVVRAMSIIDVIITKATRSISRDVEDIGLCSGQVNLNDVLRRIEEYSLDSDARVRDTVYDAL